MQITWKKSETKNIRLLVFSFTSINLSFWCFFVPCFLVVCKISNFNMWTAKQLAQVSCTELPLRAYCPNLYTLLKRHSTYHDPLFFYKWGQKGLAKILKHYFCLDFAFDFSKITPFLFYFYLNNITYLIKYNLLASLLKNIWILIDTLPAGSINQFRNYES